MQPRNYSMEYYLPIPLNDEEIEEYIDNGNEFTDEKLDEIGKIVEKEFPDIEDGDVIYTFPKDKQYRNQGVVFWIYNKVVDLSFYDEYGNVPSCFQVDKYVFHPKYWINSIAHNNIFWLGSDYIEQFVQNMDVIEMFGYKVLYSVVDIKGELYCLVNLRLEDILTPQDFAKQLNDYEPLEWHSGFDYLDLFHIEGNFELEKKIKEKHNINKKLTCISFYQYLN